MKKLISIIIPCFNEEEMIPLFYKEIKNISNKMNYVDFEYIFIDDGSTDESLNKMRNLSKEDKRVKYISFSRNFGKEAGMIAGLEKSIGDYVAIMDVDLQDPPEKLIDMYKVLIEEDYDCAALYTKTHEGYSFIRRFLTNRWYKLIDKISKTKQMPGARDFRLMTRKMVNSIISLKEYNRYTKGIFSYVGFKTKWLEYIAPNRKAGTSKFTLNKLIRYALEGIVSFSTGPLVVSAFLGMILCLLAIVGIIVIITKTVLYSDPVAGWPSMMCFIMFFSGIQLFFFGIMGIYVSKIYLEVKQRPVYIIKETEKED